MCACPGHTNSLNNTLWLFILVAVSSDSLQYGTESVGFIETLAEKMLSIPGSCPLPWSWNYISGHQGTVEPGLYYFSQGIEPRRHDTEDNCSSSATC